MCLSRMQTHKYHLFDGMLLLNARNNITGDINNPISSYCNLHCWLILRLARGKDVDND